MSLHVSLLEDRDVWEEFLDSLGGNEHITFYHSWPWGDLMAEEGRKFVRVAIHDSQRIVAVGQVQLRSDAKLRIVHWWYCPRGLAMDYSDPQLVTDAHRALADFFSDKSRAAFLRVDPNIVQGDPAEAALDVLRPTPAPVFTQVERCWIAEIQPTEEQQWAWLKEHSMSSKTKRFTNKARKNGVTVRASDNPDDIEVFLDMLHQLDDRKGGIGIHRDDHYRRQFAHMAPAGSEKLFIAEKDGHVGAINLMAIHGGEASYLHGASSKDDMFRPLSPATLLHIDTMRWLAEYRPAVKHYNFWGIISDENRAKGDHPRHGYSEYKRSFGGYKVEYLRARDFVYNKPLHFLSWQADAYRTRKSQND